MEIVADTFRWKNRYSNKGSRLSVTKNGVTFTTVSNEKKGKHVIHVIIRAITQMNVTRKKKWRRQTIKGPLFSSDDEKYERSSDK